MKRRKLTPKQIVLRKFPAAYARWNNGWIEIHIPVCGYGLTAAKAWENAAMRLK